MKKFKIQIRLLQTEQSFDCASLFTGDWFHLHESADLFFRLCTAKMSDGMTTMKDLACGGHLESF